MLKMNFQTKGVILTAKQKSQIEKKLSKLKKYFNNDPVVLDIFLSDDTSPEKGGVDQVVHLSVNFSKEKIFIEEKDERLIRAFMIAYQRLEKSLRQYHQRKVEQGKKPGGLRLEKVWGIIRRK